MVKSLGSPTVNPAAPEAVKPEVSASRYTYLKHNMNWTRSVLGAKDMPVYEKTARVAAAFFVALAEFFVVNGAFLIANAVLFIANQAHRAFAKKQIEEIELPPSPKPPQGGETSNPTIAQLPDTATPDGQPQYIEFRVPNLFMPEDQPSAEEQRSPRAEDLAAAVAAAAADALPQPEMRPDVAPVQEDAASLHNEPQPLPVVPAAADALAAQDDAVSIHSEPQRPASPAREPVADQEETESLGSADQDLLDQAIAASLLPPSPTASENAAAVGLFADLEEEADLLEQTLASAQQQQPAPVDAETLAAALNGVAEDLDDAMLREAIAASQETRAELPASPARSNAPTPVELQPISSFRAQYSADDKSDVGGEELVFSNESSRASTPVAALLVEEPAAANQSPKAASRAPTPVAAVVAEEQPAFVAATSPKAPSRVPTPVAALIVEQPAAANQSPKAASRVPTPVATVVAEEQPAFVATTPKANSRPQSPAAPVVVEQRAATPSPKAASRVPSPVAVEKVITPAASPVQMQQAERIATPILPFLRVPSPAALDLAAEESDDSGNELGSTPSQPASPRSEYGNENLLTPASSKPGSPRAESPVQLGDEDLLSPAASQHGTPRAGSPVEKAAPGVSPSQKRSPRSETPTSEENSEVDSQDGVEDDYESESDDAGSNMNSPAASPKPAAVNRFWSLFGK